MSIFCSFNLANQLFIVSNAFCVVGNARLWNLFFSPNSGKGITLSPSRKSGTFICSGASVIVLVSFITILQILYRNFCTQLCILIVLSPYNREYFFLYFF